MPPTADMVDGSQYELQTASDRVETGNDVLASCPVFHTHYYQLPYVLTVTLCRRLDTKEKERRRTMLPLHVVATYAIYEANSTMNNLQEMALVTLKGRREIDLMVYV